jgi:hypothetical protein
MSEVKIIQKLQDEGYHVVVNDPLGKIFTEKYKVYQNVGWDQLKVVIVTDYGTCIGLQG